MEVDTDPATYLHAKWVHLIGAKKAALLTGSANLSRSALLRSADTGNIELGVLTVGARREFDRLYAPLSMTPIDDLHDLGIAFRTEPEPVEESTRPALLWSQLEGTTLTLTFDRPVDAALVRSVHGAAGPLDLRQLVAEGTTIFVSLTPEDAAVIAEGGHLDICLGEDDPVSVSTWPYHLALLWARLAHPTNREVIYGIAPLPERDADLFDLLRQLEATLIFDPFTAWHTAEPDSEPEPTADDQQIPRWQDLDWQRIRRDPRYAGYHDTGPNRSTAPTAVQIMLAVISGKLTELVPPDPATPRPPGPGENEDDLAGSPTAPTPEEEDPDKPSPPPPGTKTRKAFNRFVSRYAAATRNPDFLDELGPVLTVRNAVIFNHLLIQLLSRQIVDPARAIDAQLAVWQLLWGGGGPGEPGLLDRLEGEERDAALRVLDEAHTRTTTLQALVHAVDYDLDRDLRHHLRDMATCLITAPRFNLDAQLLEAAAPTPAQASALLDNLKLLAGQLDRHDIADFVLEPLHCTYHDVEWKPEIVPRPSMITGKVYEYHTTTLVVHRTIVGLDPQAVRAALERFAVATTRLHATQDYWRIRFTGNGNDVGYWDAACGRGLTIVSWADQEFETFAPARPRWRVQLDDLRSNLAPRRQSA
ncbi:hypothetical protein [Rhodococcus ruber]|uniref:hypothetical protein n=1 Tax=Rhodococcus ruber TaxID=1830 RepID=UPI001268C0FF|nr:hypothetical protein [Rhodococcus ruber]